MIIYLSKQTMLNNNILDGFIKLLCKYESAVVIKAVVKKYLRLSKRTVPKYIPLRRNDITMKIISYLTKTIYKDDNMITMFCNKVERYDLYENIYDFRVEPYVYPLDDILVFVYAKILLDLSSANSGRVIRLFRKNSKLIMKSETSLALVNIAIYFMKISHKLSLNDNDFNYSFNKLKAI